MRVLRVLFCRPACRRRALPAEGCGGRRQGKVARLLLAGGDLDEPASELHRLQLAAPAGGRSRKEGGSREGQQLSSHAWYEARQEAWSGETGEAAPSQSRDRPSRGTHRVRRRARAGRNHPPEAAQRKGQPEGRHLDRRVRARSPAADAGAGVLRGASAFAPAQHARVVCRSQGKAVERD